MIRDYLAKLVRRMQHRHSCLDNRIVLDQLAAVVLPMKDDRDVSNDNKMAAMFTMTGNERVPGKGCSHRASDATHAQCE